jgi:hypothetical protein
MKGDGLTKFSLVFKKNRGGKAPKISRLDGVLRGNIYVILKEISSVALLSPACFCSSISQNQERYKFLCILKSWG